MVLYMHTYKVKAEKPVAIYLRFHKIKSARIPLWLSERAHEIPVLAEALLEVTGCWGMKSPFFFFFQGCSPWEAPHTPADSPISGHKEVVPSGLSGLKCPFHFSGEMQLASENLSLWGLKIKFKIVMILYIGNHKIVDISFFLPHLEIQPNILSTRIHRVQSSSVSQNALASGHVLL